MFLCSGCKMGELGSLGNTSKWKANRANPPTLFLSFSTIMKIPFKNIVGF